MTLSELGAMPSTTAEKQQIRGDNCHLATSTTICKHQVQFYDEDEHLQSVLCDYLAPFLDSSEVWLRAIILARAPITTYLGNCLLSREYASDGVISHGEWDSMGINRTTHLSMAYTRGQRRIFLIDADMVVAELVHGGELNAGKFDTMLSDLLLQLVAGSPMGLPLLEVPIYAYGELVDILCARGQHLVALELESCWNRFLATANVSLLCGYKMDSFRELQADVVFDQICHSHTAVAPTEKYSSLSTAQEKLAMIATLQQKALKLRSGGPLHSPSAKAEQRVRYREQFVETLCHELRNPVSGIVGNVELLQEGLDMRQAILHSSYDTLEGHGLSLSNTDVASLRHQLADDFVSVGAIAACADQMKTISNDVLNLSKLEEGKAILEKVPFDPRTTVVSVVKMFSTVAQKKGLAIISDLPDEKLIVVGDPCRIAQVITNLISNAIKFTNRGSITVQLRCLGSPTKGDDSLSFKVAVRDTGRGLSQEESSILFQRFSQTPTTSFERHGGTGLGLYISKYLVELMGGAIYVESRVGSGSTFIFTFLAEKYSVLENGMTRLLLDRDCSSTCSDTAVGSTHLTGNSSLSLASLPTSSAPSLILPAAVGSNGKCHQQVQHVLVVDDDPIILRTIQRVLESDTHLSRAVSTACNGYDAISKLIAHFTTASPIDVVLMDLEMPFMDGLQAARNIRRLDNPHIRHGRPAHLRRLANTPIIGLTGDIREERLAAARRNGMDDCVEKPVAKAPLLKMIERVSQQRLRDRSSPAHVNSSSITTIES